MDELRPIPDPLDRSWTLVVDGRELQARFVELRAEKFGSWTYGADPRGYDTWRFRENGRGGAISLPYAVAPDGSLWVGLVEETRPNLGPGGAAVRNRRVSGPPQGTGRAGPPSRAP